MGMSLSSELKKLYVGSKEVKEAYIGSSKIYPIQTEVDPVNCVIVGPLGGELSLSYRGSSPDYYIEYSILTDPSNLTWYPLSNGDVATTTENIPILLRGNLIPVANRGIGTISIQGECFLGGNCMALLYGDDAYNKTTIPYDYAFYRLFANCTNIKGIDYGFLPATTLSTQCYAYMFKGCTGLLESPLLPATNLVSGCYQQMFYGCTNLFTIYASFLTTPSDVYTEGWVTGVAGNGVFYRNKNASWNVIGNNGIPFGWTIQNL